MAISDPARPLSTKEVVAHPTMFGDDGANIAIDAGTVIVVTNAGVFSARIGRERAMTVSCVSPVR